MSVMVNCEKCGGETDAFSVYVSNDCLVVCEKCAAEDVETAVLVEYRRFDAAVKAATKAHDALEVAVAATLAEKWKPGERIEFVSPDRKVTVFLCGCVMGICDDEISVSRSFAKTLDAALEVVRVVSWKCVADATGVRY